MRRSLDAPLDPAKHLGHGKCDTFSRSTVFGVAINHAEIIGKNAVAILRSYTFGPGDLRGLGLSLSKLEPYKSDTTDRERSQIKLPFQRLKDKAIESLWGREVPRLTGQNINENPITNESFKTQTPKTNPEIPFTASTSIEDSEKTPLDIQGTQFLLPPDADPSVLAELPGDILGRLKARGAESNSVVHNASLFLKSRFYSPESEDRIPLEVDPDVFKSLPEDLKAEVLLLYGHTREQEATPKSSGPVTKPRDSGRQRRRSAAGKQQPVEVGTDRLMPILGFFKPTSPQVPKRKPSPSRMFTHRTSLIRIS